MKVTSKDVLKISNEIFKSDNIKMGVVTSAKNAKELKDIIKTI
jgi:hypothetical protein